MRPDIRVGNDGRNGASANGFGKGRAAGVMDPFDRELHLANRGRDHRVTVATCHRGGTLPFAEDPRLVLENAYTNYKLVMNDRSWGVHNPRYARKLLTDSIASVKNYLAGHDL